MSNHTTIRSERNDNPRPNIPFPEKKLPLEIYEEKPKPFDHVGFIIDYESGELDQEEIISGFQHLIDSGLAFSLQGHYGRTASSLIQQGHCTPR